MINLFFIHNDSPPELKSLYNTTYKKQTKKEQLRLKRRNALYSTDLSASIISIRFNFMCITTITIVEKIKVRMAE
jgi:hypothetical protein